MVRLVDMLERDRAWSQFAKEDTETPNIYWERVTRGYIQKNLRGCITKGTTISVCFEVFGLT